jgi:hypothetical protein
MVSNMFAKSLGYGGSAKVKTTSSIQAGGGNSDPASKASKASNGDLCAAKPIHKKTYQNRAVTPGSDAKGHGGSVSKAKTIADPQETAKQTKGQTNAKR